MRYKIQTIVCVLFLCASIGCSGGISIGSRTSDQLSTSGEGESGGAVEEEGGTSEEGGEVALGSLAAPGNVRATSGSRRLTITWDPVEGASAYNIYWKTSAGVETTDNKMSNVTSPYVHTGLTNGTTYYYVVTAEQTTQSSIASSIAAKAVSESDKSSEASVKPNYVNTVLDTLTVSGVEAGDLAGRAVSISDDIILTGVPYFSAVTMDAGTVGVFSPTNEDWSAAQSPSPTPIGGDLDLEDYSVGFSIAFDGTSAIVGGAFGGDVYFFSMGTNGSWAEGTRELSGNRWDLGCSVDIRDSVAVAGVPSSCQVCLGICDMPLGSGDAYIYEDNSGTWTKTATVSASDGQNFDYFGWSVATNGTTVVVGATGKAKAYLFQKVGGVWTETGTLTASDAGLATSFGTAVDITSEGTICVGAPGGAGSVYIFRDGTQVAKIAPSDLTEGAAFGSSLACTSKYIVGGAPTGSGAVYVYDMETFTQIVKLTPPSPTGTNNFGTSVAIEDYIVVGSPGENKSYVY